MCAKKKDDSEPVSDTDELEVFVSKYMDAYRSYLNEKDMDERHLPQFYKGFPFNAEIYRLPNEAVCVLFRKSNRSKLAVMDGNYDDVKGKLDDRALDFMQVFPPFTSFDAEGAERLAHLDAERDLKVSRRLEILSNTEIHIDEIHEDMKGMLELNPWLDEQAKTQKEKLDRAKELILELYKEVDMGEEEKFADYAHSLMEIMAFERAEMETVAGEVEVEMESVLQEVDERTAKIEKSFESYGKALNTNMSELEQQVKDMKKNLDKALKDGGKSGDFEGQLKELRLRVDALAEGEGMSDELDMALTKVRGSLKDTKAEMIELKKEFKKLQKDVTVTKEIKDTVFRDSKRTHNLNDRVSDIEKELKALSKTAAGKNQKSEIKALEGKLNVAKKEILDQVKLAVEKEVARAVKRIKTEAPPPPVEMPKGATMKKTTKKKTTKKTRKKK